MRPLDARYPLAPAAPGTGTGTGGSRVHPPRPPGRSVSRVGLPAPSGSLRRSGEAFAGSPGGMEVVNGGSRWLYSATTLESYLSCLVPPQGSKDGVQHRWTLFSSCWLDTQPLATAVSFFFSPTKALLSYVQNMLCYCGSSPWSDCCSSSSSPLCFSNFAMSSEKQEQAR